MRMLPALTFAALVTTASTSPVAANVEVSNLKVDSRGAWRAADVEAVFREAGAAFDVCWRGAPGPVVVDVVVKQGEAQATAVGDGKWGACAAGITAMLAFPSHTWRARLTFAAKSAAASIDAAFAEAKDAFAKCQAADPKVKGTLILTTSIDGTGRITDAQLGGTAGAKIGACATEIAKRVQAPATGKPMRYRLSLEYRGLGSTSATTVPTTTSAANSAEPEFVTGAPPDFGDAQRGDLRAAWPRVRADLSTCLKRGSGNGLQVAFTVRADGTLKNLAVSPAPGGPAMAKTAIVCATGKLKAARLPLGSAHEVRMRSTVTAP